MDLRDFESREFVDSEEVTMFGYGIVGTIIIILVVVWLVRRA